MSKLAKALSVLVLTGLGMFALVPAASAHNSLTGSNPADKAVLDTGPAEVVLTFDQPVQEGEGLNTIAVTGPDGEQWQGGGATVDSNVVSAPVRELGPSGVYTIGYRIVSADGHPVSGELTFTVDTAGNGTPAAEGDAGWIDMNPGGGGSGDDEGGMPVWVWLAGAVVLLGAGLFVALRLGGGKQA
ncbi:copper resistance CopC family protein [Actinophytocola glycyrrhizae]|uniref:Copper resistance protein CopC n=1 Tax=Actinophytocola glycyrrhizae TaxID=2044873 RepID=A0ABV9RZP3_9PSEU